MTWAGFPTTLQTKYDGRVNDCANQTSENQQGISRDSKEIWGMLAA